ncbi:MAG: hypothetical protein C0518_09325 [Opitutus sp.]|nr:hypothetical protein [Opitutus sp.]
MKKLLTLVCLFFASALSVIAQRGSPISYSVSLASSTYDATANTTTFTYTVTSNPAGGPAISHWVIGIPPSCGGAEILVNSNDALVTWVNSDPTTGVRGIKFDTGYDDVETRTVTLTLAGNWSTGTVEIAVKSGNGFVLGTTQGPVCGGTTPPPTYTVSGLVFFDANYSGTFGADEIGLGNITVTLLDGAGNVVASTTSASDGSYSFTSLLAGDYTVVVGGANGLAPTTLTDHDLAVSGNSTAPDTGFALNFSTIGTMSANGFTIGYWKNNLEKALKGTTKGVQVSAATLSSYTTTVGSLALSPFTSITMAGANSTLSATGSDPRTLLAKQLLASEYNYANGAYLNGDASLTYLFVYYGEYVLKNASSYDSTYLLNVKNWFDAYNNTHGGVIVGPAL